MAGKRKGAQGMIRDRTGQTGRWKKGSMFKVLPSDEEVDDMKGIHKLREALDHADAVIIRAGAGLFASAGFVYTGRRFDHYFHDFSVRYNFSDMYTGGFYPYRTLEEYWAYWSRYIYINRYMDAPYPVYDRLYELVRDKDYFVITTNVDHCFQKAGFDWHRLFCTQGDYGLFQCSEPCCQMTYDNRDTIFQMVRAQGYVPGENGALNLPEGVTPRMTVPSGLVPYCPVCHRPLGMNLRADDTFVEDEDWRRASDRYVRFLRRHQHLKVLFLELAVGYNTPAIVKYSFWRMVHEWKDAVYVCVNNGEAYAPDEIREKSVCINADAREILECV